MEKAGCLRIATWNVASNPDLPGIAARLTDLDIDVCALQEVAVDPARHLPFLMGGDDSAPHGLAWHFAPTLGPRSFGGAKPGYFGLGVIARIPVTRTASFLLGPFDGNAADAEREPRLLQVVRPQVSPPLIVANTHLAATDWSLSDIRRAQAARIAELLRPVGPVAPTILCGDFNTWPGSRDLEQVAAVLPHGYAGAGPTYNVEANRPPVDFFLASRKLDLRVEVHSAREMSDHDIVVGILEGFGAWRPAARE